MTTLITTLHGIGVGVMGYILSKKLKCIDKILARDRGDAYGIDNTLNLKHKNIKHISTFETIDINYLNSISSEKWKNKNYLYIENSCGFSNVTKNLNSFYIPMWEQGNTIPEAQLAKNTISITNKTQSFLTQNNIKNILLPFPVEVPESPRQVKSLKKILHNAGSLGGKLRKGTIQAIQIFQLSGLSEYGVELHIHSWKTIPEDIQQIIAVNNKNIIWSNKFYDNYIDIYQDYDLLLFPSKIEGHAMVVMEAMSHGIPVLCTNVAPINEYVIDDLFTIPVEYNVSNNMNGDYSIVDVKLGAERLKHIKDINITDISNKSYELMRSTYSWDVLQDKWEELLS